MAKFGKFVPDYSEDLTYDELVSYREHLKEVFLNHKLKYVGCEKHDTRGTQFLYDQVYYNFKFRWTGALPPFRNQWRDRITDFKGVVVGLRKQVGHLEDKMPTMKITQFTAYLSCDGHIINFGCRSKGIIEPIGSFDYDTDLMQLDFHSALDRLDPMLTSREEYIKECEEMNKREYA